MKTREEIKKKVIAIVADTLNLDLDEVTEEKELIADLGADSLDTLELIMEFEKEFKIKIPDNDTEKIVTVKDAIDYIEKHQ